MMILKFGDYLVSNVCFKYFVRKVLFWFGKSCMTWVYAIAILKAQNPAVLDSY